jgi:hypothetical protein
MQRHCLFTSHIHHWHEDSLRRDKKSMLYKRAGIVRFSAAPPGLDYLPGYALSVAQVVNMGWWVHRLVAQHIVTQLFFLKKRRSLVDIIL